MTGGPCRKEAPTDGATAGSILVVDDEEGLRASLVAAFVKEGYRVAEAASGREALATLRRSPHDILLTDLVMPGMDGIALMERVLAEHPGTVVILMTGGATVESAVRALKGGAYDYLVKPFTLAEIFHVATRGLEERRLRQENLQLSEINRRLQEIDQLKSNLLSVVSHEFRTPLTIMHGWLDLLQGSQIGALSREQQESLQAVRQSAARLGRLIANLLAFVEYEHGAAGRDRARVDLLPMLQEVVRELAADAAARGLPVKVEATPALPALRADAHGLRLLFFNLVENAIKFNRPGGRVEVEAQEAQGDLEVRITNTRGEIPADQIPRLLQPFTQGDMSMTRTAGGLGLGLAVGRAILEAHGGRLRVESDRERGTTIRVRLPAVGGEAAAEG